MTNTIIEENIEKENNTL